MPEDPPDRLPSDAEVKVLSGWKRWLPFYLYKKQSGWKLHISLPRFGVWLVFLLILAYVTAGTALFLNDRYRHGLTKVSWFDRIYPPRWEVYRGARGLSFIEMAEQGISEGNFSAAFHQLRVGLARYPRHRDGRLLLAELYKAAERPELSQSVLIDGFKYHESDLDYQRHVVRFLFSRQADQEVSRITRELLPQMQPSSPQARFLAISLANSLYFRGQFDQAEDVLSDEDLVSTPDGRLLSAKIEWDRGFPELALALIQQLADNFPSNAQIYQTQVRWLVESGEYDSARRASLLRRLRFPDQPQPRIDLLYAYDKTGEDDTVIAEASSLLRDFGENYAVVLQVGDFAANTGRPDLATAVLNHAGQLEMPVEGPSLMLVESMIVAERYEEALEIARTTIESNPDWEERLAPVFNGLRAICYFALGDREDANLLLNSYLDLEEIRAENLVAVAERLVTVGAQREARIVLEHAVATDPLNQPALTRLIELDLSVSNAPSLPQNVGRLLSMRRSSPEILRKAYDRLGEDKFLFVENRNELLDALLASLVGKSTDFSI